MNLKLLCKHKSFYTPLSSVHNYTLMNPIMKALTLNPKPYIGVEGLLSLRFLVPGFTNPNFRPCGSVNIRRKMRRDRTSKFLEPNLEVGRISHTVL